MKNKKMKLGLLGAVATTTAIGGIVVTTQKLDNNIKNIGINNIYANNVHGAPGAAAYTTNIDMTKHDHNLFSMQNRITNGFHGTIFEDSKHTLWAMGNGTPLQKSTDGGLNWISAGGGNNITHGNSGTIFEDSKHTLWAMGNGTPLQKSLDGGSTWIAAGTGNKITYRFNGTIFEDSNDVLWAMASKTPLQKSTDGGTTWISAGGGSNITNGSSGTIFEDSKHTLWAMGLGTPLQKSLDSGSTWIAAGTDNNIKNGFSGTIFEDSNDVLWAMSNRTPLQKSIDGGSTWIAAGGGSNITNGFHGTIFEDWKHTLWAMGNGTPLQKSTDGGTTWISAGGGNNITHGNSGTIFEDSKHTLWAMGNGTPLQKSLDGGSTWIAAGTDNNINNGFYGTIFEDSNDVLWAMGNGTPLQKSLDGGSTWITNKSELLSAVSDIKKQLFDARVKVADENKTAKEIFAKHSTWTTKDIDDEFGTDFEGSKQLFQSFDISVKELLEAGTRLGLEIEIKDKVSKQVTKISHSLNNLFSNSWTQDAQDAVKALNKEIKSVSKTKTFNSNEIDGIIAKAKTLKDIDDELGTDFVTINSNHPNLDIIFLKAQKIDGNLDIEIQIIDKQDGNRIIETKETIVNIDNIQKDNLALLDSVLIGGSVVSSDVKLKATEIAAKIKDAASLKAELGIDLTGLDSHSTYAITALGDASGKITVSVVMTTSGALTPTSVAKTLVVSHTSDAALLASNAPATSSGLSTGAIVGIVLGLLGLITIPLVGIRLYKKKKSIKK